MKMCRRYCTVLPYYCHWVCVLYYCHRVCVLYYCHGVSTQLQLTIISYSGWDTVWTIGSAILRTKRDFSLVQNVQTGFVARSAYHAVSKCPEGKTGLHIHILICRVILGAKQSIGTK